MTYDQILNSVARIIWPEAMNGETENGRLDEAVALDTAEKVYDELLEHFTDSVKDQLREKMEDEYLLKAEHVESLEDYGNTGDGGGVLKVHQHFIAADEWLDSIDLEVS